jgi:hypothetical protein
MEMVFPRRYVPKKNGGWVAGLSMVATLSMLGLAFPGATAAADDAPPPPLHHVKYTITSDQPYYADIYYRDTDPANFAEYSHNPYQFSPKVEADVGPAQPWVLDVMLANPYRWAMVVATSGQDPVTPNFHCELEVDGAVLATNSGPKGALCSIRSW